MRYFVYKITNLLNGKIYIGAHRTKDIEDGYMGSGNLIKRAIEKHGKKYFKKEILKECETLDDMYDLEKQIVNIAFVKREDTYNIRVGGWGGKITRETANKISSSLKGSKKTASTRKKMSIANTGKKLSEETKEKIRQSSLCRPKISDKTREKLSIAAKANLKNKSKGTVWINNGSKNRRISKECPIPSGWEKGRAYM